MEHLKSILADCLQIELESRTINTIISRYPTIHTFVNISNDEPIARGLRVVLLPDGLPEVLPPPLRPFIAPTAATLATQFPDKVLKTAGFVL